MFKTIALGLGMALLLSIPQIQTADGAPRRTQKMSCTPKLLHPDDTLKITLPFPHGNYFDVYGPGRGFFMIGAGTGVPLIPYDTFQGMRHVELEVREAEGIATLATHLDVSMAHGVGVVVDKVGPTKIFVKAGRYRFEVGADLETDSPFVQGRCSVRFVGRDRRRRTP